MEKSQPEARREGCGDIGLSLSRVVIEPTCLPFGLQRMRASFGRQHFGAVVRDEVQFPEFEEYASLTFVVDYIVDSSSHMTSPRRDRALVLLQI